MTMIATLLLLALETTTVQGKWTVVRDGGGRTSTVACNFVQSGKELSGTCSAANGPVPLKGTVDGNKITWTYTGESEGGTVTVTYKGTIEKPDLIQGGVTVAEYSIEGEFKATPAK